MITSFRIYNAVPGAARAWRALFERVFADTGLDIRTVEHRSPQPIAELWADPGLCCGFMCGWPFARAGNLQAIAAPVPSLPRYEGLPRYCSEFLVRKASGWRSLEETFGQRFGWTAADSQSGFNAPRAHLAQFVSAARPALYREVKGPLGSPAAALDALRAGEVDVVALDGYFLDLCRAHDPSKLEGLQCVGRTPWTPIPLLVAAPGIDAVVVSRLQRHLAAIHADAGYAPLLAAVLLERFVVPDVAAYGAFEAMARFARERGYAVIR